MTEIHPAANKTILTFLKQEAGESRQKPSGVKGSQLSAVYGVLIDAVLKSSDDATLATIVSYLASANKFLSDEAWRSGPKWLVQMSSKMDIKKEELRPILESKDEEMAEFGRQLWGFISYVDPKSDLEYIQHQHMYTCIRSPASRRILADTTSGATTPSPRDSSSITTRKAWPPSAVSYPTA